ELVFAGAADHLERDNQRDVQSSKFNGDDRYDAQRTSRVRILHEPRDFWHGKCTRRGSRRICDGGYVRALPRNSPRGADPYKPPGFDRRLKPTCLPTSVLSLGAVVASVTRGSGQR